MHHCINHDEQGEMAKCGVWMTSPIPQLLGGIFSLQWSVSIKSIEVVQCRKSVNQCHGHEKPRLTDGCGEKRFDPVF